MGGTCPQGHDSTWDDFCSVCGDSMDGGANAAGASAQPDASSGTAAGSCPNCADPYDTDDVFCESCGYDFATGTLPAAESDPSSAATPAPAAAANGAEADTNGAAVGSTTGSTAETGPALIAVISCDRRYFDQIVGDAGVDYPDPEPDPTTVAITGGKILIGRHNESRGVYPEINVDACTNDPAVSTRHAMLLHKPDGSWVINDLGSTNGTLLNDVTDPLTPGTEVPIPEGTLIYLGAYTKIAIEAAPEPT